jgi:chromosome segregation ATPase
MAARRPPRPSGKEDLARLYDQSLGLKKCGTAFSLENTRLRTRVQMLDRELGRRDRVLRDLSDLKTQRKALSKEKLEKIREERNMIIVYRKSCANFQLELDKKEAEVHELKRNLTFTSLVELDIDRAVWADEEARLRGLVANASDQNPSATSEVQAWRKHIDNLDQRYQQERARLNDDDGLEEEEEKALQAAALEAKLSGEELHAAHAEATTAREQCEKDLAAVQAMKEASHEVDRLRQSCKELEAEAKRLETDSQKVAKLAGRHVIPAPVLSGEVALPGLLDLRLSSRHSSLGAVLAAENAERNGVLTAEELERALSRLHVAEHTAEILKALPAPGQEGVLGYR